MHHYCSFVAVMQFFLDYFFAKSVKYFFNILDKWMSNEIYHKYYVFYVYVYTYVYILYTYFISKEP